MNKEILQNYNSRLNANNTSLDDVLDTVNQLPEYKEIKLQDKEVTPTKETQNIVADNNYDGLNQVTIEPIPEEYIIPEGMLPITENTTYDVRRYATVSASVHPTPNLQDKSITITENGTQNITADSGYDGLRNVNVNVNVEVQSATEVKFPIPFTQLKSDISKVIYDYMMNMVNNFTPLKDEAVTLYSPLAENKYYAICKTSSINNEYKIVWFQNETFQILPTTINTKYFTSGLNIHGTNWIVGNLNVQYSYKTKYVSTNIYNSVDECIEAMKNPTTTYSTTTSDTIACYKVEATTVPCIEVVNGDYGHTLQNRISANETIEVIG